MSAQFDRALAEAAEAMDLLGSGWDEVDPAGDADDASGLLPLEFQLADLVRAVDTMIQERDRFLQGSSRGQPAPDVADDGVAPDRNGHTREKR